MELPKIIIGDCHIDHRGTLFYNNNFDATSVKRVYFIENRNDSVVRGWQGHKIEKRWFSAVLGSFKIRMIKINNWELPSKDLNSVDYKINSDKLEVLYVPKGYVTSIQSMEKNAKLLVMADYLIGETKDEYRYPINYFEKE
jgi:dTDP-4-dehydrorhamnose 3,5-epimerase-like enzyme